MLEFEVRYPPKVDEVLTHKDGSQYRVLWVGRSLSTLRVVPVDGDIEQRAFWFQYSGRG